MYAIGIDYSTTSPAICIHHGDSFSFSNCKFLVLNNTKKYYGCYLNSIYCKSVSEHPTKIIRYSNIADEMISFIKENIPNKELVRIALEDYAFGAMGRVFHIAENCGLLKYKLWSQLNIIPDEISPTHIKKLATGKGSGKKDLIYQAFLEETKIDLIQVLDYKKKEPGSPVSDLIDAYYIAKTAHNLQ